MNDFLPSGDLSGAVNPYTGKAIPVVDSRVWGEATSSELYKQLYVLENRLHVAQTLGKVDMIRQLHAAITNIKAAITEAVQRDAHRPTKKRPNYNEPTIQHEQFGGNPNSGS